MPDPKRCKDCATEGVKALRPAPEPGPRCATHWRIEKKRRSKASHANRVEKVYGISGEEYDQLYQHQGGKCYICQRATGQRKRLAVDHNHDSGAVRGLLCTTCNYTVIGRYDIAALSRAIYYLVNEPAQEVLGERKIDVMHDSGMQQAVQV